jgi:hypothetical protein
MFNNVDDMSRGNYGDEPFVVIIVTVGGPGGIGGGRRRGLAGARSGSARSGG